MCYKEFIAYQCGHRSVSVVRPCPLTTAGHNFPVCGHPPDKPHYAETMCAACERQLHSRWVLIREWEHRWLHERGVCGCEVTFPGLLTTPRAIGDYPSSTVANNTPPPSTRGHQGTAPLNPGSDTALAPALAPRAITHAEEGSTTGHSEASQSQGGDARVPALFTEAVTATGERHVAVRLSSLYAAEWQADHRALHESGKCSCPTSFAPFRPSIPDDELTAQDRERLREWRKLEAEHHAANGRAAHDDHGRDIDGQVDETMQRLADIEKAFGKFDVVTDEPPKVNLPQLGAAEVTQAAVAVASRGQPQHQAQTQLPPRTTGRHHRHPQHNRRLDPRRVGESGTPTHPIPQQHHQQQQHPQTPNQNQNQLVLAAPLPSPNPNNHPFPDHHFPFPPAHPTYATPATYTDTIPHAAYPWAASEALRQGAGAGMGGGGRGTDPYRTPGFRYDASAGVVVVAGSGGGGGSGGGDAAQSGLGGGCGQGRGHGCGQGHGGCGNGYGCGNGHGHGYPASSVQGHGQGQSGAGVLVQHQHHQQLQLQSAGYDDDQTREGFLPRGPEPLPLCGLPIGAGPEGVSHMPSWEDCPLRRGEGRSVRAITAGGEQEEEEDDDDEQGWGQEEDDNSGGGVAEEEEARGGNDTDGEEDENGEAERGRRMMPLSPPRRRHSAAT